jgi:hypothetical protein
MSWGKGIAISFIAFTMFIGLLVAVCVRQDINLVSKNYYDDELKYQDEIDRLNNAAALAEKPSMQVHEHQLELTFNALPEFEDAQLVFTRPSDARYDATFAVSPGPDSRRVFDVSSLPPGRYVTSLRWKMNGKEFLVQESVTL